MKADGGSAGKKMTWETLCSLRLPGGYVDMASINCSGACADGTHIDKAVLTIRKAGGKDALEFFKITLEDITM